MKNSLEDMVEEVVHLEDMLEDSGYIDPIYIEQPVIIKEVPVYVNNNES
jgi:hypothetical protein